MNILICIHNQFGTGPYFKVLEMSKAISGLGHRVTLFCTHQHNRFSFESFHLNGLQVVESPDLLWGPMRQGIDPWNTIRRTAYLLDKQYDIIHAIDCRPVVILPVLFYKRRKNIPLIISWWDWFGRGGTAMERSGKLYANSAGVVETFFEEHFRRYADRATVITDVLFDRLVSLGYPGDKIELHRVGCFVNQFKSISKVKALKITGLETNRLTFCYVGALFEKDKKLLIDSLHKLKTKIKKLPQTILIGPHKINEQICHELSIKITGHLKTLEDVYNYLFAADFALMPMCMSISNKARWPSKITDYWAAGLPVVSTPVSDYKQLFEKHKLGILAHSDSVEAYTGALETAVEMTESQRMIISRSVRTFAETELDWSVLAKRLIELYFRTFARRTVGQNLQNADKT